MSMNFFTPSETIDYLKRSRTSIYLSMTLQPIVGPWSFFSFLTFYTVDRTPWREDQQVARPLPTLPTTQTQNKRIQTFMPPVGFEPTIPMFEWTKIVHASDRAATVLGRRTSSSP
jgi:hypothetical protein